MTCSLGLRGDLLAACPGGLLAHVRGAVLHGLEGVLRGLDGVVVGGLGQGIGFNSSNAFTTNFCFSGLSCTSWLSGDSSAACPGGFEAHVPGAVLQGRGGGSNGGAGSASLGLRGGGGKGSVKLQFSVFNLLFSG